MLFKYIIHIYVCIYTYIYTHTHIYVYHQFHNNLLYLKQNLTWVNVLSLSLRLGSGMHSLSFLKHLKLLLFSEKNQDIYSKLHFHHKCSVVLVLKLTFARPCSRLCLMILFCCVSELRFLDIKNIGAVEVNHYYYILLSNLMFKSFVSLCCPTHITFVFSRLILSPCFLNISLVFLEIKFWIACELVVLSIPSTQLL